jgi:hypothetical protein
MVPGILVVLVTMVGAYMCALNIVKEKEIGTIEQINVTPIKKYHFILRQTHSVLGYRYFHFHFRFIWRGKISIPHCPCGFNACFIQFSFHLSHCLVGYWLNHFHLFRYTATGNVSCVFRYDDFYAHEWAFHFCRQYARVGKMDSPVQSCYLFY